MYFFLILYILRLAMSKVFILQRTTGNLIIEGKGDNNSLLSGIGEEISRILT